MQQRQFSSIHAVLFGAALPLLGCGDNVQFSSRHRPDASPPPTPDAAIDAAADAAADAAVDAPPVTCASPWTDLQLGTELDDQVWGMTVDALDRVLVSGYEHGVTSSPLTNLQPNADANGVILRFDPAGLMQWKTVLDTRATDTVEDLEVDAATGAVVAVGRTTGSFNPFRNMGQFDLFLAGLDTDGKLLGVFQTGDERPAHPTRLSLGQGQDLAVAGFDDMYVPDGENFLDSFETGFLATFERSSAPQTTFTQTLLNKVQQKATIPHGPANFITDVVVERDGSGDMYFAALNRGNILTSGIYVQKVTRDGTFVWNRRITTSGNDIINAVALSPSNELYVTGAAFTADPAKQQDAFVMQLDKATGEILLNAQAGGVGSDWPTSIAFDPDGNIYIAGLTTDSVVEGQPFLGEFDVFAMKFDAKGSLLSSWLVGTPSEDWATSMVVDSCGRVLVGGYTKGDLVRAATNAGGYDMFVVRAQL